MIDHTGISVTDFARSLEFYRRTLEPLGYSICIRRERVAGFGVRLAGRGDDPGGDFWIAQGEPFSPRSHVAFRARNRAEVDRFYAAAIAAGGRDNGAPEVCAAYHPNYYAGFVFDPDGYNIEAVCHTAE